MKARLRPESGPSSLPSFLHEIPDHAWRLPAGGPQEKCRVFMAHVLLWASTKALPAAPATGPNSAGSSAACDARTRRGRGTPRLRARIQRAPPKASRRRAPGLGRWAVTRVHEGAGEPSQLQPDVDDLWCRLCRFLAYQRRKTAAALWNARKLIRVLSQHAQVLSPTGIPNHGGQSHKLELQLSFGGTPWTLALNGSERMGASSACKKPLTSR